MAGQRNALIIANDTYDQEALQNLLAPAADAEALGRVLGDPRIGGFAVQVVQNEPAHVIQAQIEELFSESRPDDVVLLHFSGHGLKSESGELYFAASNTRPNRLRATAVSAEFVQQCMRDTRSRSVVLLLDCCYGGAFAQGVRVRAAGNVNVLDSFPQGKSGGGRGRAVISASSAMEFAFEGEQLGDDQRRRPSVFTSALVEGLATGDADRDEDGWVSLDELYDYLFDKVREQNPHQTPSRAFELEGELYLARSQRQRVRPAPIPADLRAALADPNIYARLGAVGELRARLASDNIPAAAGAHEALRQLADSDISYVARSAAEALSEAAVHPIRRDLHFGRVERGSAPPHRMIRLLGPPIARACAPCPSHEWIRVHQVADELDISVDTSGAGTLRGSIGLKGPTGEAVIAVDVDLVSPAPQTSLVPSQRRPAGEQAHAPAVPVRQAELTPVPAQGDGQEGSARPAKVSGREQASPISGPRFTPHPTRQPAATPAVRPAVTPAVQPPVRMGTALAGLWVALLAGTAGLMAHKFQYSASVSFAVIFSQQAFYAVPMAVAVAGLLLRRRRRVILGLLQGMWWPAASWLAWPIVAATKRLYGLGSSHIQLEGFYVGTLSSVLGVIAAILLLASWNPGPRRSGDRKTGALPVMLVCCVSLSQIAGVFLYESPVFDWTADANYAQGAAAVVVGLAVSCYAVSLRTRTLGGVLILGWATTTVIWLISTLLSVTEYDHSSLTRIGHVATVPEFAFLAAAIILAVVYMRGSPDRDPGQGRAGARIAGNLHS
ncbi:MAG: caspase family protein [Actinobacteria bacterium]|nr:caspase family protein [Actinomycetota bacterium]